MRRSVLCDGLTRKQFHDNRTVQLATPYLIQIIGKAARHGAPEGREPLPDQPWPRIVAMRNRIVHDYTNVDHNVVWDVVTYQLPPPILELEKVVPSEPPD